ncbi:glycosyltransferase [Candidatus Saccharibacteria bacterium]|nr:glycosyltransferase [Candidatus Saccharibacteria bacterium]
MNRLKQAIVRHEQLHRIAKKAKRILKPTSRLVITTPTYDDWISKIEPGVWEKLPASATRPLLSVVVPVYNTPDKYILPLIDSLINQTYNKWELILVDGSTDDGRKTAIKKYAKQDDRIKHKVNNTNLGISGNTNVGLKAAKGEFIGFLDHDDVLSPYALEEVVVACNKNSKVEVIYSDEDKLSDDGRRRQLPFFKPDWSPDLLLGVNYITHFLVVRHSLVEAVNGLRPEYDGAQDYDFLLRVTERTDQIVHIPKILYHWRLADGSTSVAPGEKNYADTAGNRALADAIKRRKVSADVVEVPERPTNYRLRYVLPKNQPKVSIIIPFKDKPGLLEQCTNSIFEKTTYKNYELILVSNNSTEDETHTLIDKLSTDKRVKAFVWNQPFNYSKVNNFGVSKSDGEYVVLLNNDTEVITPEWLDELVGVAMQPGVGAVGPMLLYPDKKNGIQHAGVILGMKTMAGHVFRHRQAGEWTDFGLPSWPRNYLAVTAACLAVSRAKYDEIGGLDEKFIVAGNDVAFCLSLHEAGYRNIYWPLASLHHHESVSVKTYSGHQSDYDHSLTYYKKYHESGDPYFNKNLDLMNEQVGVGVN